jgi:hypothetical protein
MSDDCQHDTTYRAGAIWEICHDCGRKWADDEGGRTGVEPPLGRPKKETKE